MTLVMPGHPPGWMRVPGATAQARLMTITNSTAARPAGPRRPMRPWLVLITAIALTLVNVLAGGVLVAAALTAVLGPDSVAASLASRVCVAVTAGFTAYLWWRLSGRPGGHGWFATSGIRPLRTAPRQFALGGCLALLLVSALAGIDSLLGIGHPAMPDHPGTPGGLVLTALTALLSAWAVQGFPEELLWRGQAARELSRSWSPGAVIAGTSLAFGALHILSNSGASTWFDRSLYVVAAMSFGFLLASCRAAGRSLWLGIGYHGAYDLMNSRFLEITNRLWLSLTVITLLHVAAGMALLSLAARRAKDTAAHAIPVGSPTGSPNVPPS